MARQGFWNKLQVAHEFTPVNPFAGRRVLDTAEP